MAAYLFAPCIDNCNSGLLGLFRFFNYCPYCEIGLGKDFKLARKRCASIIFKERLLMGRNVMCPGCSIIFPNSMALDFWECRPIPLSNRGGRPKIR